ncbi:MAG: M23 family metallopeptidase, partial [Actinomycetota bacterium]|nr:M23 family metallopeptidase [Actinomycetota bacterium]
MLPILLLVAALGGPCVFDLPVEGPIVRGFAPSGAYGGHWGIDLAIPDGSPIRAAAPGVVTFSGEVAGRSSITIHHGGSVRTSYSYLSLRAVGTGDHVGRGQVIGSSGVDHGVAAIHFAVRIGERYIDT